MLAILLSLTACQQEPTASADGAAGAQSGATAGKSGPTAAAPPTAVGAFAFDAARSFGYLEQICAIGPRIAGTEGMQQQQQLLEKHFTDLGASVFFQEFDAPHPQTGLPVHLRNLIVTWHPDARERVFLCCHYDTRPRPDREPHPANRDKPFLGANDGGSGVALLMELGHHMRTLKPTLGVDFVFFDAEELVYDEQRDQQRYFLGSTYFAEQYRDRPPPFRYRCAVLLDMVGSKEFKAYYEGYSLQYAPELTKSVWDAAAKVGVREFVARRRHEVRDDHLPLNRIARIPACDVIDFDYPYWHLRNDIPAACSGETLRKVALVMATWLQQTPQLPPVRAVPVR